MIQILRTKPLLLDALAVARATHVADERRPGRADRELESAEQLHVAELAPTVRCSSAASVLAQAFGALRFGQQRAVGSQRRGRRLSRGFSSSAASDAADGVVIALAQGVFERGRSRRGEIAGEHVETL